MRKYILNIDRLYTGDTANALVLNQVDEELPTLLPSVPEGYSDLLGWIQECKKIHPEFKPPSLRLTRERLNEAIVDFNLNLQDRFKKRGHQELYLMDDTKWKRPEKEDNTFATDKVNMHLLNGQAYVDTDEVGEDKKPIKKIVNSSQLNVIFPFKKVSSKSLYAEQLSVESPYELDAKMENSRQMSLQGKDTSSNCLQGIATVGGNLYVMSPLVESKSPQGNMIANGLTIVNSFVEKPYHFPHTMTLFQPSRDRYDEPNMQKDEKGVTPFITWYENHSRKTVVSLEQDYGSNISKLNCIGAGSYEIELATYSPTGIVVEPSDETMPIPLNMDKFREIRADEDAKNKYRDFNEIDENGQEHIVRKYVFDNGDDKNAKVGFNFNLYDNFISGSERTLRLEVPKDKDFNKLHLKFQCVVKHEENLLGDYDYIVMVDDEEKYRLSREDVANENIPDGEIDIPIDDAVLQSHSFDIKVIVHYQVDFSRRSNEKEYQDLLKNSGITLMDIRIENDVVEAKRQLTFADYVNEIGISEDERARRYEEFWQVSQYKKDIPYQLVLETSLRNITSSGIGYPNNYSTGDIYGDVFVTKSMLDPNYNMNLTMDVWNDNENRWATDEEKASNKSHFTDMIHAVGREYLGMGQCSSQLFLKFKPTDMAIGYENEWKDIDGDKNLDPDKRVVVRRT